MVQAKVRFWLEDEGRGVLNSSETPGGCWAHFGFIEMEGYHNLSDGQLVQLEWEIPANGEYGGYVYFATRVIPL